LAKYFFKKQGIKVAKSQVFNYKKTKEILKFCNQIKYPVVIKPLSGIQGMQVFVGLSSDRKVVKALKEFRSSRYKTIIVEKEFKGEEYRIFATREKFVAAIHRVPANVVGDGKHSIKQLIKIKNEDPRRGRGHKKSLVKIKIDKVVRDYLKKQKLRLTSVPKKDQIVYLRQNSNISTGGDSYDVTDIVHPKIKKLAVKVIRAVPGLAYAGIDYLTKDITAEPTSRNYIIIEVNDSPMISMHHVPYSGKERNAAKVIIDQLYPETKRKK
jgi:cyanophycin synthetase